MGHSPTTENRHKINKDDYKGMFLLAKIGVIAVHCLIDTDASYQKYTLLYTAEWQIVLSYLGLM